MQTSAVEPWSSTIPVFEKSNSSADNTGPCPWGCPATANSRIGRIPNNQRDHENRTLSLAHDGFCSRPRCRKSCRPSCGLGTFGFKASAFNAKTQRRKDAARPTATERDRIMARQNHNGGHRSALMILSCHDSVCIPRSRRSPPSSVRHILLSLSNRLFCPQQETTNRVHTN